MLRLQTFGGLAVTVDGREHAHPRRRLALLARLAASGSRGVSRDELLALFWSERDLESARHSLDQLLYEARRSLNASPTLGTTTLRLDPDVIASDVADWRTALERNDLASAVAVYQGPFLHGFYLHGSPEFERWTETARAAFDADYRRALEALATTATANGRFVEAVSWWRRLAAHDRLASLPALGLMRALVDAGDRAGALEFARVHERIVRTELDSAPDPAVASFANDLRAAPTTTSLGPSTTSTSDVGETPIPPRLLPAIDPAPHRQPPWANRRMLTYAAAGVLALFAAAYSLGTLGSRGIWTARVPASARRYETSNIVAHDLYERGRDPTLLRSDTGQRAAIGYLTRAVEVDPAYAAAYAMLADRYASASYGSAATTAERHVMHERGEAAARRAITLDDSLADGHAALGFLLLLDCRVAESTAELERAVALDPNSSTSRELLTKVYELAGRASDALAEASRAVRADPMSASANAELGSAYYHARRYDEALAQLSKVAAVQPPLRRVSIYTADVYAAKHRWHDAISILEPVASHDPLQRGLLGYALAKSGERAKARQLLTDMLAAERAGSGRASAIAEMYAGLGDYDNAFAWLERSFDDYSFWARLMGPLYDDLHADPRFAKIRRRLGIRSP